MGNIFTKKAIQNSNQEQNSIIQERQEREREERERQERERQERERQERQERERQERQERERQERQARQDREAISFLNYAFSGLLREIERQEREREERERQEREERERQERQARQDRERSASSRRQGRDPFALIKMLQENRERQERQEILERQERQDLEEAIRNSIRESNFAKGGKADAFDPIALIAGYDAACKESRESNKKCIKKEIPECAICFDKIDGKAHTLLCCGSVYKLHIKCKKKWKDTRINSGEAPTCPMCRAPLE